MSAVISKLCRAKLECRSTFYSSQFQSFYSSSSRTTSPWKARKGLFKIGRYTTSLIRLYSSPWIQYELG